MSDVIRCRAAETCRAGNVIRDPDTSEIVERVGALIEGGPLCPACVEAADYAISALPRDLHDLALLLPPSMQVSYRDPEIPEQPRVKKPPPLPWVAPVFDLMEYLVYEVTVWTESVADHAGVDWDSRCTEQSSWQHRVRTGCDLLHYRLMQLLKLTDVEHRARSVTENAWDGHDPDRVVRSRDDWWVTRDGWQAALLMVRLHRDAEYLTGRAPGTRVSTPCARCNRRALRRNITGDPDRDTVRCDACGFTASDEQHEDLLDYALREAGLPPLGHRDRVEGAA